MMPDTDKEVLKLMRTPVPVPTAIAMFPRAIYQLPRVLCEKTYPKLRRYVRFKSGGHFAPMECPDVFVDDVIDYFVNDLGKLSKL